MLVGAGKKGANRFHVSVKNTGADSVTFSGIGFRGALSLECSIGTQAEHLLATLEEASEVKVEPPEDWEPEEGKMVPGEALWSFRLPNEVLTPQQATVLTVSNFECNGDPGKARVTLRVSITGYNPFEQTFHVEKQLTAELQLLYFEADPPLLIKEAQLKLEWNVINAGSVVLYKWDKQLATFNAGEQNSFKNGERFTYRKERPSLTTEYSLVAIDKADPKIRKERKVTVHALKPGWHKIDDFRQHYGYPATLCNLNDAKLYGIFVADGKARLCSSAYPAAVWDVENLHIPERIATSPAVCFGGKMWLVGGSAADPNVCSNEIWSYEKGSWTQHDIPGWSPRMGHGCVVHDNRIWVLGGMDEGGNTRNEVWSSDMKSRWKLHYEYYKWGSRCMAAATVFGGMIWLYGGVKEPFGDPWDDMWTSANGDNWSQYSTLPDVGQPLGCSLQVLKTGEDKGSERLHLLGTFRRPTETKNYQCILEEGQRLWDNNMIATEQSWDKQGANTFSLASAQFNGLVFARSLNYETLNNPTSLHVYVP